MKKEINEISLHVLVIISFLFFMNTLMKDRWKFCKSCKAVKKRFLLRFLSGWYLNLNVTRYNKDNKNGGKRKKWKSLLWPNSHISKSSFRICDYKTEQCCRKLTVQRPNEAYFKIQIYCLRIIFYGSRFFSVWILYSLM